MAINRERWANGPRLAAAREGEFSDGDLLAWSACPKADPPTKRNAVDPTSFGRLNEIVLHEPAGRVFQAPQVVLRPGARRRFSELVESTRLPIAHRWQSCEAGLRKNGHDRLFLAVSDRLSVTRRRSTSLKTETDQGLDVDGSTFPNIACQEVAMRTSAILTVLGCDRPGLTRSIAEAVAQVGGNWLESHLSHLRGMYVGSVLIELPEGRVEELRQAMARIDNMTLDVTLLEVGPDREREGSTMMLELVAQDRPGIVREVTSALASIGVNIESFESSAENSSWSGARLFRAIAELMLQPGVTENNVRAVLEDISGEIMVDLDPAQPSGHVPRIDAAGTTT